MDDAHTQPRTLNLPDGTCQCGCGGKTKISDRTDPQRGVRRGHPLRFINGHGTRGRHRHFEIIDAGYTTPCWIRPTIKAGTYTRSATPQGGIAPAHRLAYEEHYGPIPPGLQIDHLCRNRACINPDHLEPVTNAENTRRGDATKLTWDDVHAIRASTATHAEVARSYNVNASTISRIRSGHKWVAP